MLTTELQPQPLDSLRSSRHAQDQCRWPGGLPPRCPRLRMAPLPEGAYLVHLEQRPSFGQDGGIPGVDDHGVLQESGARALHLQRLWKPALRSHRALATSSFPAPVLPLRQAKGQGGTVPPILPPILSPGRLAPKQKPTHLLITTGSHNSRGHLSTAPAPFPPMSLGKVMRGSGHPGKESWAAQQAGC